MGIVEFLKEKLFNGEAETIDNWLESHKGKGTVCLPREITVYFPMSHSKSNQAFEELLASMSKVFGGATDWPAEGVWCEDENCKKVDRERIRVIQSAHHCNDEKDRQVFTDALKKAEKTTEQISIGIKGTNKFFVIPLESLK